jgi:hypothetical protein
MNPSQVSNGAVVTPIIACGSQAKEKSLAHLLSHEIHGLDSEVLCTAFQGKNHQMG